MLADRTPSDGEQPKDRGRRIAVLAGLAAWLRRLSSWRPNYDFSGWRPRYRSVAIPFTKRAVTSLAAIGGAVLAGVGALFLTNTQFAEKPAQPVPPQRTAAIGAPPAKPARTKAEPVKVETQRWGASTVYPVEGKDRAGKRAAFDVAVLPKEVAWARKSSTELTEGGQPVPRDIVVTKVFTAELREGLARSSHVIAVGMASQEGAAQEETERARNRARSAAAWLAKTVSPNTKIWVLNLGQFQNRCTETAQQSDTSWQRPVMLIGVRSQQGGVRLREAFADAISGKANMPSRDCYSSFDLARFR